MATYNETQNKPVRANQHAACCHEEGHSHEAKPGSEHNHDDHDHDHGDGGSGWRSHWDLLLALVILITLLILKFGFDYTLAPIPSLLINLAAYVLAGQDVFMLAIKKSSRGDFFNEFVLMTVATIGAFILGEYEEGVAVMVFYQVGEWFQDAAVSNAKRSIKSLLDIRPDTVTVIRNGQSQQTNPAEVKPGEIIEAKPGEKIALDGVLASEQGSFNTAALTGESKPDTKYKGEKVFSGMINLNTVVRIEVSSLFKDSKLSQILSMVQDATARKSQTQLFISRFAKVYTPIVFLLALLVCVGPILFVENYVFTEWFYRALVFLVISCPCALVVSIPLGYFGGIGLASRNGLLFKGGNFLDVMTKIDTVVMDKTGTITKGVFNVQEIVAANGSISKDQLLDITAAVESNSTHPVAKAVVDHLKSQNRNISPATEVEEIAGQGLKGRVGSNDVLAGNLKLLDKFSVAYPPELKDIVETIVVIAIDSKYAGYITIADELKDDAAEAIRQMHNMNLKTVMLSGDKRSVVEKTANAVGIDSFYSDLLPDEKVMRVQELKDQGKTIAFVGDGVNDAPVVALADAGIAMGGLGSDATIETADIV
ncbi:MAG: cadmium-translocating P-type ATPase, partial [Chitinophagaceae bacterium]